MDRVSGRFMLLYSGSMLKLKYRQTMLGFLWNFLEPALYLIVLSVVFSVINRMNIGHYAVYLFGALLPWRYFERSAATMMDSLTGGEWLLKKARVSPLVFPLARWIIASAEFVFSFSVVLLVFVFLKETWTIHLLVLPLAVIPWALLGLGFGLICSVVFVFFRDIGPIIQMILMLTFFSSPILFEAGLFTPGSLQSQLIRYHPITYFAALFQKPIYYLAWPGFADWAIATIISLALVLSGFCLIRSMRSRLYFYL